MVLLTFEYKVEAKVCCSLICDIGFLDFHVDLAFRTLETKDSSGADAHQPDKGPSQVLTYTPYKEEAKHYPNIMINTA